MVRPCSPSSSFLFQFYKVEVAVVKPVNYVWKIEYFRNILIFCLPNVKPVVWTRKRSSFIK